MAAAVEAINSVRPLDEILANRRWVRHADPFPHVTAEDVFVPEVYAELDAAVAGVLDAGTGVVPFGWYDALGWGFRPDTPWPLGLFISPEWHDLIAGVAGVGCNGYVNATIHSHAIGSASGTLHSDLNPVYFPRRRGDAEGTVRVGESAVVDYQTGELRRPGVEAVAVARAVALLYYVNNEEWRPGDGGETGLYSHRGVPVSSPDAAVPPVNNSLVLFECTPASFHTFLSNTRTVRNAVVMWLHRDYEEVTDRWGETSLVRWNERTLKEQRLAANQAN